QWSVLVNVLVRGVMFVLCTAISFAEVKFFMLGLSSFKCAWLLCWYIPPLLWGKSGHLQTALYGKLGRVSSPHPCGVRKYLPMQDGATATFDLFEPLGDHQTGEDITMVICPGIGNHSEKHYIRTFVDHSQKEGYRCAVLNHLGALPNIELTSPRMFTYGCTWEFSAMVGYIKRAYPHTKLIVVGFSLGGNIVCKFLGESQTNQEQVMCCVSVCQGYSALRAQETFLQWDHFRRFYNFLMADNMKKIILSHRYRANSGKLWDKCVFLIMVKVLFVNFLVAGMASTCLHGDVFLYFFLSKPILDYQTKRI
uniref:AB hydrolase-1 domain-containing protein n=1 Tax=Periophthalmus magnuspinnatus TaxID=409849 RepID=A0A3B4B5Y1_9GOBI